MRRALLLALVACACTRSDDEVDRLLRKLRDGDPAGRALADLGPAHAGGVPAILEALDQDERRFVRLVCLEALLSIGAAEEARASIEEFVDHRDAPLADRAALVHWKLYGERDPGLARLLARARAHASARAELRRAPPLRAEVADEIAAGADLEVLAALGPAVEAALPRIEQALDAENPDTRIRAAKAHFRISGRLQPAFGVLVEQFAAENVFLRQRIHAIWLEMLEAHPEPMREELRAWKEEPLRTMAERMLGE